MLRFPKNEGYLIPAGTHAAVCYCIVELGTQETNFGGKPQVHIGWEVPDERLPDGRVAVVSRRYTISAHQKGSLRGAVESWQGRRLTDVDLDTFEFDSLIGQTCLVSVQHSDEVGGRIYANVVGVMPPPRGADKHAKPENPTVFFEFGRPDASTMYSLLPEFLRTAISRSPEYPEHMSGARLECHKAQRSGAPPAERLNKAQTVLRERLTEHPRHASAAKAEKQPAPSEGDHDSPLPDDDIPL
jgi:hypothetical protein